MKSRSVLTHVLALVLLIGTTLAITAPGCLPIEPEEQVCKPGYTYDKESGTCVPGCQSDKDCGTGNWCEQVICVKAPCYGVCHEGCKPGTTFDKESGTCVPGCQSNSDCGAGKWCEQVICVKAPCYGICQDQGYCNDPGDCEGQGLIHPECVGSWGCKENQCVYSCSIGPLPNECTAIKSGDFGMCKMLMGYGWNGSECTTVGGCGCDSNPALCKYVYASRDECKKATDQCKPKTAWYTTCGGPVCYPSETKPDGVEECGFDPQEGQGCSTPGKQCWTKGLCVGSLWTCADTDPKGAGCPRSQRKVKKEITYLSGADLNKYYSQLLNTRLATYEYKNAKRIGDRKLGFIIDDTPKTSMMVNSKRTRVDLYGYTSMAVAGLKVQAKQIDMLKAQIQTLTQQIKVLQATCGK
ncbi:MAG: hypothetical protein KC609_25690 [Myxococcales bacterium]|nr:hypothetical protein [Myxococcales bacterium]